MTYSQVQKCLPLSLSRPQETFFHVVRNYKLVNKKSFYLFFLKFFQLYDITTGSTYFGLEEFYTTIVLVDMINKQE